MASGKNDKMKNQNLGQREYTELRVSGLHLNFKMRRVLSGPTNLLTLFHNPMKCEKWVTAFTIMCPYHCNSKTHSIVIASHDFQLQTDWFKCKLEQFLLQYFPRPAWHFSRVHRIFMNCFTPLFLLTSCCDNKIVLVWNLWMVIIHGIICMQRGWPTRAPQIIRVKTLAER